MAIFCSPKVPIAQENWILSETSKILLKCCEWLLLNSRRKLVFIKHIAVKPYLMCAGVNCLFKIAFTLISHLSVHFLVFFAYVWPASVIVISCNFIGDTQTWPNCLCVISIFCSWLTSFEMYSTGWFTPCTIEIKLWNSVVKIHI